MIGFLVESSIRIGGAVLLYHLATKDDFMRGCVVGACVAFISRDFCALIFKEKTA